MIQFQAFDQQVELSGHPLVAIVKTFPEGTEKVGRDILAAKGIEQPRPTGWYRLQTALDMMKGRYETFNADMLSRMGYSVAQLVDLPPWGCVDIAFKELDSGYQNNHRGGEIGKYSCDELGTDSGLRHLKITTKTRWPRHYELGLLQGIGDRFKTNGMEVLVREDETTPCKRKGADSCTFIVTLT